MAANLLFIGSPLLDVSLKCSLKYLDRHGLNSDDCVRATTVQHQELFSDILKDPSSKRQAGGSAQNSARVCRWIMGDSGVVSFAGCVGVDDAAAIMSTQLAEDGVEPLYSTVPSKPTGLCACLVGPTGDRSMVTEFGAASSYDLHHLQTNTIKNAMTESDIIYVVGYFLAHSANVVQFLADYCHDKDKLFAISLSAPYICKNYSGLLMKCLPYVDLVFGNYEEAKTLLSEIAPDGNYDDPQSCAKSIAALLTKSNNRIVVITNGSKPLSVCESNSEPAEYPIPRVTGFVDTIGCGDAIAGAFLATYATTKSVNYSVKSAIIAATKITQVPGCTIPK